MFSVQREGNPSNVQIGLGNDKQMEVHFDLKANGRLLYRQRLVTDGEDVISRRQ